MQPATSQLMLAPYILSLRKKRVGGLRDSYLHHELLFQIVFYELIYYYYYYFFFFFFLGIIR